MRLVHISDNTSRSIHTYHWCISWYHLLGHKVVIGYTIATLVREALHEKRAQTQRAKQAFKQNEKISKELLSKYHSIIQH